MPLRNSLAGMTEGRNFRPASTDADEKQRLTAPSKAEDKIAVTEHREHPYITDQAAQCPLSGQPERFLHQEGFIPTDTGRSRRLRQSSTATLGELTQRRSSRLSRAWLGGFNTYHL